MTILASVRLQGRCVPERTRRTRSEQLNPDTLLFTREPALSRPTAW